MGTVIVARMAQPLGSSMPVPHQPEEKERQEIEQWIHEQRHPDALRNVQQDAGANLEAQEHHREAHQEQRGQAQRTAPPQNSPGHNTPTIECPASTRHREARSTPFRVPRSSSVERCAIELGDNK